MLRHIKTFEKYSILNENIEIHQMDPAAYENETVTSLPYSALIKDNRIDFLKKLVRVCKDLEINPLWLMHTIFHESRFDSKKSNRVTKAVGLLSFLPEVYKNLIDPNTGKALTEKTILNMSNIEQLDLIYSYYESWFDILALKEDIRPGDFAAITFYPGIIKKKLASEFPREIIEINKETFDQFAESEKTKEAYYKYTEDILNKDKPHEDRNTSLLGQFSGAIVNPQTYLRKKPLEYYLDILMNAHDPELDNGIQQQDLDSTERRKQMDDYNPDQLS